MSTSRAVSSSTGKPRRPARITNLKVENFRALRKVEFKNLTPLTVLLGPNGSGKSTVFDVFAFLSECFESGLRRAWDRRGRAKELKSRGCDGPLVIEIKYNEPGVPLITYHLAVDERMGSPIVVEEWLRWKRGSYGQPFNSLITKRGAERLLVVRLQTYRTRAKTFLCSRPTLLRSMRSASSPIIHVLRRCATSLRAGTSLTSRLIAHAGSQRLARKKGCPAMATTSPTSFSILGNGTPIG